jgi:trans-aconitate methyltransferase
MKYIVSLFLLLSVNLFSSEKFDNWYYEPWQKARLEVIIDHYGEDWFKGKKVLEVGAGYGYFSEQLKALGADVTGSDARMEYVIEMRDRGLKAVQADLDANTWSLGTDWDLIIHFGVLYHLGDHVIPLIQACKATKHMVLETEVCDSDHPYFLCYIWEPAEKWDGAYNALSVRPSPQNVERVLDFSGATYEMCLDEKLNVWHNNYTWQCTNTYELIDGHRRFWFVETGN